ncbi:MAG: hypothetical protein PHH93_03715 [Prolixibacteraceae bacterium]|nr:hypothetical protein [Prolixibacteraceae bacterium]
MKIKLTILLVLITTTVLFAQKEDGKRTSYQFKQRVGFYTVDNRYNLKTDTIYHSFNGFHVWSDYDTIEINKKVYLIFTYYNFEPESEKDSIKNKKICPDSEKLTIDTLCLKRFYGLFNKDSMGVKIYKQLIDSIKVLSRDELSKKPVHVDLYGKDGLTLAFPKEDFEKLRLEGKIIDRYSLKFKNAFRWTSGWITVPFKFRPKIDTVHFNLTTDVTLGAYFGPSFRIARYSNNHLVIPLTIGLSYINVGNSETSNVNTTKNSSIVPGLTWSSGVVFDLNGFNIGFVAGQDFASGVGKKWIYNNKFWYSFSIGHSFFAKSGK